MSSAKLFTNTITVSNGLDPDQDRHCVAFVLHFIRNQYELHHTCIGNPYGAQKNAVRADLAHEFSMCCIISRSILGINIHYLLLRVTT